MTLNEIFEQLGIPQEQIEAITKAMKENKIFTTGHENMDVRYPKLKQDFDALTLKDGESTKLIEQLQKDNKGNAALQQSVTDYQNQLAALQAQNNQQRLEFALKVLFMEEKALDVDYMVFKAMEKHPEWKENPETALDENGKVKGGDDLKAGMRTQHPAQFEGSATGTKTVEPQPLPGSAGARDTKPTSLAEALQQQYDNPNNM